MSISGPKFLNGNVISSPHRTQHNYYSPQRRLLLLTERARKIFHLDWVQWKGDREISGLDSVTKSATDPVFVYIVVL